MSYNSSLPADTTVPEEIRENFRALKEDKIVAAASATTADLAAAATKLATAVNINGVSFDGSEDITITAEADYDGGHLLTANGYQQLSNGLILQWGVATGATATSFPIAFPNQCFAATAALSVGGNTPRGVTSIVTTTSTITIYEHESDGGESRSGDTIKYIAVGY
ncbi:MAG: hypothetical protein H6Q69_3957 [Firmicutes bacterium]|nr:hypothetical protein [Bacillota bacterium]